MASNNPIMAQNRLKVKSPNSPKDGQASQEVQKREMITAVNLRYVAQTHAKVSKITDENAYLNRSRDKENITPIDGRTVTRPRSSRCSSWLSSNRQAQRASVSQEEFWAVWTTLENDPVRGKWRSGQTKPCVDCAATATRCRFATPAHITCIPCQDAGLRCSVKARFGIFRVAQLLRVLPTWVEDCIDKGWDLGPGLAGGMLRRSARKVAEPTSKIQKSPTMKKKIIRDIVPLPSPRGVVASSSLQPPLRSNDVPQIPTISIPRSSGIKNSTTSARLKKLRRQVANLTEERDESRDGHERIQREASEVTVRFENSQKALNEALARKMQLDEEVVQVMEENREVVEMYRQASEDREYWKHEAGRWRADAEYHFGESRERGCRAFRANRRVRDLQRDQYYFHTCVSAAAGTILGHLDRISPRSRWSTVGSVKNEGTSIRQALITEYTSTCPLRSGPRSQQRTNFCPHGLPLPHCRLGGGYGH